MLKSEKWILDIVADLENATAEDLDAAARYLDAAVRGGGKRVYAEALAKIEAEEQRRDQRRADALRAAAEASEQRRAEAQRRYLDGEDSDCGPDFDPTYIV
jgi:hypothetical protein